MPRRGVIALALTTVALVLLLSFKTPAETLPVRGGGAAVGDAGPGATSGNTGASATVDGPVVDTRYGPVQVEISVAAGRLQDVVALQMPSGRRSGQISRGAEPILRQEALGAQSASIDLVSGATYTSDAYAQPLQAALDQTSIG